MTCYDVDSFVFNQIDCRKYGLMMCWFNDKGGEDERDTGLNFKPQINDFNMVRNKYNQYGVTYDKSLTLEFGVTKIDGTAINNTESLTINKWLNVGTYLPLKFNNGPLLFNTGDLSNIIYYAICTSIKDVYKGKLVGKLLKFETNSPFGYSRSKNIVIPANSEKIINNNSDEGIYYPVFTLSVADGFNDIITIKNMTEDREMFINFANISDRKVIIDSSKTRITNADGKIIPIYKIGWEYNENNLLDLYWPRLMPGNNEYKLIGEAELEVSAEFPRKVGILY